MWADPQSVPYPTAGTKSLARVSTDGGTALYQSDDGNSVLANAQSVVGGGKRNRRASKLTFSKVAADPLNAAQNLRYSTSVTLVIDSPVVGFTPTELLDVVKGFLANLAATSDTNMKKLIAGEP